MYDDFYGFSGRPFQLTPDPDFFFESATHRKALSYLGYGLAQGEGFIVITGEVGAGKSTLVAHLMATIDPARLTAAQIVTSALDGSELVHIAAQAFGLAVAGKDKPSALRDIEQFLHAEARAGRRCLLVVDEAQNLSVAALEELRMLSNFQLGAHPLLQILLLGQPEFRQKTQAPELEQLRQRVIATHHLEAMEPDEVGAYVEHRLARVGWDGNPAFDSRVYADLARASGGIPRRINQIVARLLLLGAVEQRSRIDCAMLDTVLADLARDAAVPPAQLAPVQAPAPVSEAALPHDEPALPLALSPDLGEIRAELAKRDALIAELQAAVVELSDHHDEAHERERAERSGLAQSLDEALRRVATLEARGLEQERTIRHTLTMLIEWIEADDPHRVAA